MAVAWFVVGQATAHTRTVLVQAAKEPLYAPPLLDVNGSC
jgi:hypothetical protein